MDTTGSKDEYFGPGTVNVATAIVFYYRRMAGGNCFYFAERPCYVMVCGVVQRVGYGAGRLVKGLGGAACSATPTIHFTTARFYHRRNMRPSSRFILGTITMGNWDRATKLRNNNKAVWLLNWKRDGINYED